jgi:hypothetical protein
VKRRSLLPTPILSINERIGKWLIRHGLFNPNTRLGRLAAAVGSPVRGLETGSQQIAEGNRKVFEEIGREFSRFLEARVPDTTRDDAALRSFCEALRAGPPPDGQDRLKEAFTHYYVAKFTPDATERAQREYLANVLVHRLSRADSSSGANRARDDGSGRRRGSLGARSSDRNFQECASLVGWVRTMAAHFLRVLLRPARGVMHQLIVMSILSTEGNI